MTVFGEQAGGRFLIFLCFSQEAKPLPKVALHLCDRTDWDGEGWWWNVNLHVALIHTYSSKYAQYMHLTDQGSSYRGFDGSIRYECREWEC